MGRIGTTELLLILGICLLVFGPKTLPKLGSSIGKAVGQFKKNAGIASEETPAEEEV